MPLLLSGRASFRHNSGQRRFLTSTSNFFFYGTPPTAFTLGNLLLLGQFIQKLLSQQIALPFLFNGGFPFPYTF